MKHYAGLYMSEIHTVMQRFLLMLHIRILAGLFFKEIKIPVLFRIVCGYITVDGKKYPYYYYNTALTEASLDTWEKNDLIHPAAIFTKERTVTEKRLDKFILPRYKWSKFTAPLFLMREYDL